MKELRKKRRRKNLAIIVFIFVLWAVGMLNIQGLIRRGLSRISEESRYRSHSVAEAEANSIPDYAGRDYIFLNNGVPNFNTWDLEKSGNHVLYRVTPYFKERELLARGVEMETYSVEDMGASLCFHVFLYNIQPGIVPDYATGKSQVDAMFHYGLDISDEES